MSSVKQQLCRMGGCLKAKITRQEERFVSAPDSNLLRTTVLLLFILILRFYFNSSVVVSLRLGYFHLKQSLDHSSVTSNRIYVSGESQIGQGLCPIPLFVPRICAQGLWYNRLSINVCGWMNDVNNNWLDLLIFLRLCPFSRTGAVVLLIQLLKALGVHMDLRFSYDDPRAILSPEWNLLSWVASRQMAFLWSPTPCILYMSAGIAPRMERQRGTQNELIPFFCFV